MNECPLGRNGVTRSQLRVDELLENAAYMNPLGGGRARRAFDQRGA
jgi:hypothetical protein